MLFAVQQVYQSHSMMLKLSGRTVTILNIHEDYWFKMPACVWVTVRTEFFLPLSLLSFDGCLAVWLSLFQPAEHTSRQPEEQQHHHNILKTWFFLGSAVTMILHLCCLIIFMLELKSQLNFQSPIHWLPSAVGMHQGEFDFATRTVTSSSLVVFLLWGSHWICSFSISFLYSLPSSSSVFLPHIASSSFILWVARFWACLISWKGEKKKRTF